MNGHAAAPGGQARRMDQESFMREIASLRTYLLAVARAPQFRLATGAQSRSDLVDSVLVDAFKRVRRDDGSLSFTSTRELMSWLTRRLRWRLRDRCRRKNSHEKALAEIPPAPEPPTPSSEAGHNESLRLLARVRTLLEPSERQLIDWKVVEGMKYREIGLRLGCSPSYAHRAVRKALENASRLYQRLRGDETH